ncbi:MAG: protease inhibitor I9 family protein, partial [Deltaproteobacteria bacterium]|nr:protease inhibitor I9 family protein [Deltaproteobacteria bacterium]
MHILATSLALTALTAVAQAAPSAPPAKFMRQVAALPGRYIVVLKTPVHELDTSITTLASRHGAAVHQRYSTALRGFAATMPEADALALSKDPAVDHVEEDGIARADGTQSSPVWGLDRLDQSTLPLDSSYAQVSQGAGATVYVIDSGIHPTHAEFAGRLLPGASFVADGLGTADCSGHGSHV